MKEHEDEAMPSVDKSTVTEKLCEEEGGEDMMVDVVSTDAGSAQLVEDVAGSSGGIRVLGSVKAEVVVNKEEVAGSGSGSGEDCDASGGVWVSTSEKAEVVVNEEEVAGLGEDCNDSVETRVLTSEKVEVSKDILQSDVVITVESGSNSDIAVIDSKDLTERGLTESSILKATVGSQEADVVVEEGLANNQSSAAELASSRTDEVDERSKEDSPHPTSKVITDDAQEMTDGDRVVNEQTEKENEMLVSLKISEPLTTMNPGSEDVDVVAVEDGLGGKDEVQDDIPVDPSLVCPDDGSLLTEVVNSATVEVEINVHAENLDQQDVVDKLSEKECFHPTTEVITETEAGLTNKDEIMEQPTAPVREVVDGNGVTDEKTGKEDDVLDSLKIPESLTTVNLGPEEVNCVDADMDRGEDAAMDIDEVVDLKDEVPGIDVTENSEADVEQKAPESSSGPVLIRHHEEHIKSREPIVYGRRAHVEVQVPLYEPRNVEQKLPESSSPVSEDENLKIETDSEEDDDVDDDEDDESVKEDEQKLGKQNPRLLKNGNMISLHQSRYFQPPSNEGELSVSDLVWGKVRSHPWWPGQIIDPSNASKKAMKYFKKDCFLVAYFGDHSFAWNNSSVLKPFRTNYSQNVKQTDTEIFKIAVDCALEEVSRRVELGLACSCVPKEIYKEIEYQDIENAGVRKKLSKRHEKDESASVSSFEPDMLLDYVRLLGQFPGQGDKLDLAIAKAQLSSYGHYKGYRELPEFLNCGDMLEDAPAHDVVENSNKNGEKFENDLIESVNPNKEISLSGITDDASESVGGTNKLVSSGLKKRKARVSLSNGSVKRPNRPTTKVSAAPISTPKPSFKVGALIQRVASQLTGPVVKTGGDPKVDHSQRVDQIVETPEDPQTESSVAEMLSQLHLTAKDPMKEYGFFQTIIPFFYKRRAAVFSKSLKKSSTVEKPELPEKPEQPENPELPEKPDSGMKRNPPKENEPEEFEFDFDFDFDDANDSYWTDRIIQNHSEDQSLQDTQNGAVEEHQIVVHEPAKRRRRSNKKQKRVLDCNHEPEPEPEPEVEEESELVRKRRENLATEVVLKFEEGINFCSEAQLNKMFRRFGPLMESETEVDREGGRARVVFKKCSDAEMAHNSAGRFNIFGSVNVKYELNYSPLVSYKPLPLPLLQEDHMDAS